MPTDEDLEYIISIGCTDDGSAFCPAQNALMQVVGKLVAIRTTQPGQVSKVPLLVSLLSRVIV
jgi:hypothetical protein